MPDLSISGLPAATPLNANELFPVVQGGVTRQRGIRDAVGDVIARGVEKKLFLGYTPTAEEKANSYDESWMEVNMRGASAKSGIWLVGDAFTPGSTPGVKYHIHGSRQLMYVSQALGGSFVIETQYNANQWGTGVNYSFYQFRNMRRGVFDGIPVLSLASMDGGTGTVDNSGLMGMGPRADGEAWGFWQFRAVTGQTRPNLSVWGRVTLGAPTAENTANMENGQITFSLDETNHLIRITARYSGGTIRRWTGSLVV